MAAHTRPGINADADVNLDGLTKEEKEAMLTRKMDMIRQRNKALSERHKLIEVDKKRAEEAGQAVKPSVDSQILPAEGAHKPRGRGRGYPFPRDSNRPAREGPIASVDLRDSNHNPMGDEGGNFQVKSRGGWSQGKDINHSSTKDRRKQGGFGELESNSSPGTFEYEPIVDMKDLDDRFGPVFSSAGKARSQPPQTHHKNTPGQRHPNRQQEDPDGLTGGGNRAYMGRLKDTEGPPPDPSFNPLADRRRNNADNQEESTDYRRPPRNYGRNAGRPRFKQNMRNMANEGETLSRRELEQAEKSGTDRAKHDEWKAEREKYDQERIQRQLGGAGSWKREWDADKVSQE